MADERRQGLGPAKTAGPGSRSQRAVNRDLLSLRNELRHHVKGKPSKAQPLQSAPALLGRGLVRLVKLACVLLILAVLFVGSTGVGILLGYLSTTDPVPSELLTTGSETSKMVDMHGSLMAKFKGSENVEREPVKIQDVQNTYIMSAFIAIEDERFQTNIGIDPQRILSALVSAVANGGSPSHGGSTITQQVVKLTTGDNQTSAQRKVQEWYRAVLLNKRLSKAEIMELYINLVPMGNSYVGIQTAAKNYFNKPASELTLSECAYLAGIPRAPSIYNPRTETGLRNGLRRMRIVLSKMYELKMISRGQYMDALNSELHFYKKDKSQEVSQVLSYFAEVCEGDVIEDLMAKRNISRDMANHILSTGGLTIHATFNPDVQAVLDQRYENVDQLVRDPENYANYPEKPQFAQIVIDNSNFSIAGMIGGIGKKDANYILNRAVDIRRQPGSSMKPLAVYTPALDRQVVTGATVYEDKAVYLDPKQPDTPYPLNYSHTYYGLVTVRNALKQSLNVEAGLILRDTGVDVAKGYLKKCGIDLSNDDVGIALAFGAIGGVSPLQMAGGYACLANGGRYTKPYTYTKVTDSSGAVVLSNEQPQYTQVYSAEAAYQMSMILQETVWGVTSSFGLPGLAAFPWGPVEGVGQLTFPTCGKSGTTDDTRDHWFCGYTPYFTTAVWFGIDDNSPLVSQYSAYSCEDSWFKTMDAIHQNLQLGYKDFPRPETIVEKVICNRSGQLATANCGTNAQTEYFNVNSPLMPTAYCPLHGIYIPPTQAPAPTEAGQPTHPAASQAEQPAQPPVEQPVQPPVEQPVQPAPAPQG